MRIYAKIHKLIDIKKEMGKKDRKQRQRGSQPRRAGTKESQPGRAGTQPHGLGLRQLGCRT